jgi:hypothetical protein
MKPSYPRFLLTPAAAAAGVLGIVLFAHSGALFAGPVPGNLGSGLDILVGERLAVQAAAAASRATSAAAMNPALVEQAAATRSLAYTTDQDQVKVYIHLRDPSAKARRGLQLPASTIVTGSDLTYRGGVIEAFVGLNDVVALAKNPQVSSVILAVRPLLDVGATTSQGVVQHRVNLVSQTGTGITVGVMSDSFDTSPSTTDGYVVDQTTGDLPGPSNTAGRTLPVVVLNDPIAGGSDEGRAMAQIVHDMAPGARLGFATASTGQVSFANNIRSLAGLPSGTNTVPGFAAQVIVDDLFYSDSPMFGTSIVGRAVNEVAALGVSYFSSAGNRASQQGYFSDARIVAPATGQAANPTLDFSSVPAGLYAGGFHNFRTDGTTDIAQNIVGGGSISFQWDDPFDVTPPSFNPTPILTASGIATSTTTPASVTVPGLTAGTQYRIAVNATVGSALDAVVQIVTPGGLTIVNQDTGADEEVYFFAPETGTYTINVRAFSTTTTGAFDLGAFVASGVQRVTTDYNLLFFTAAGAFIPASTLAANNIASNQPLELGALPAGVSQLVIARANIPIAPVIASKVRYVMTTGRPTEYFDYQTPITFGHNHEPGAISAAAHGPFPPYLPEDYSSPGPSYIYFDANANRLPQPTVRQKPDVAASANVNTTFFGGDSTRDADTFPNFGGTSAAAPHAAAIAALVLESRGGPGTVTQPQMRAILQGTAFPHDLDPFYASGAARTGNGGKVTITVRGNANGFSFGDSTNLSTTDTNAVAVSYVGPSSIATLSFDMRGGNTAGGNQVTGLSTPGLVWDTRTASTVAFPFTVGRTTGTLTAGAITAAFANQAPTPAVTGQFFTLNLSFNAGAFTGGSGFTFGCDRDEFKGANNPVASTFGNNADLWGMNYSIPAGTLATPIDPSGVPATGVRFSGTLADGSTFSGVVQNKNGKGYSPLDGFGFINVQAAVAP